MKSCHHGSADVTDEFLIALFDVMRRTPQHTYQLLTTTSRALAYFHQAKTWKSIQQNGMKQKLDWSNSAQRYMQMYEEIIKK